MKKVLILSVLAVFLLPFFSGCGDGGGAHSPSIDAWYWRNSLAQVNNLYSVTYGSDLFVAVGDNGIIVTSPDGVTWTPRTSSMANRLNGIAYGNGIYVAVGEYGRILTSPDGVTWSDSSTLQPFLPFLTEVTFGSGIFVASGIFSPYIYSYMSTDGITWTNGPSGIHAMTYANGMFLAVQTYFPIHGYYPPSQTIVTSPDGVAWTPISTPNWLYDINRITYGNGLFVGVGGTSYGPAIVTSADGVTWTERTAETTGPLYGITYGKGFFVAVGNNSDILVSSDGINWTAKKQSSSGSFASVVYGNGTFVVVGSNGAILQSESL
jgi:hypothetical protein